MTRSWWHAYLGATLIVTICYFLLPASGAVGSGLYLLHFAGALAVVLVGIRVNRPAGAVIWWLLAAGQAVFLVLRCHVASLYIVHGHGAGTSVAG